MQPTPTVTYGGRKLYEGIDYTVSYGENTGSLHVGSNGVITGVDGTGTVTVAGAGNYTGTLQTNFSFAVSDLFGFASRADYILSYSAEHYSSMYEYLLTVWEKYPSTADMIVMEIADAISRLEADLTSKGYTLEDVRTYPLYPGIGVKFTDYYDFLNVYNGVLSREQSDALRAQQPEVTTGSVTGVTVEGLGAAAAALGAADAQIALTVADTDAVLPIDASVYDEIAAVAVEIDLLVNSEKAEPGSIVTLTAAEREGMKFVCWTVTEGGAQLDDPAKPVASFVMPSCSVSVTVVYEPADEEPDAGDDGEDGGSDKIYRILDGGASQTYTVGSGSAYTLRIDASVDSFQSVRFTGQEIDSSRYEVKEGSVVLTFSADFMDSLSAGTYDILVLFRDGSASASLTVQAKPASSSGSQSSGASSESAPSGSQPSASSSAAQSESAQSAASSGSAVQTGDDFRLWPWAALMAACAAGAGLIVWARRSKEA